MRVNGFRGSLAARLTAGLVGLLLALAAAVASAFPAAAQDMGAPGESYTVGVGDVLNISVPGRSDFAMEVQTPADGIVELPLIGQVQTLGRTLVQLRENIRVRLASGGYFTNPSVNVSISSYGSRYVTVLGEVVSPGIITIDRSYLLSEIIAKAGGRKDSGSRVVTLTRSNGQSDSFSIDSLATGVGDSDPIVQSGDKIFVALAPKFYVSGQVTRPGEYPLQPQMTLRMALGVGGGVTQLGSLRATKVFREGQRIKLGPDDMVMAGDVIEVGERFF